MALPRSGAARAGLLAAFALYAAPVAEAAEATLRWKLKPGETLRYEFRQKNEIKLKAGAGTPKSDNTTELTLDLTLTVKGVDRDGTAEVALVVDRVRSEIRIGADAIKYDSRATPGNDLASQSLKDVYSAAVGKDYALKLDSRGRVTEAKVPDKVTEVLRTSPFLTTADGGSVFSEKGLKNLFTQMIPALPEGSVGKGARWSTTLELPVPPMRLTLTYKEELSALGDNDARVDATIDTAIKPEADAAITVDVKAQSGTRRASLDTKNGRLTESAVEQSIELTLGVMNREVEQVIRLEERLKLVP